MSFPHPSNPTLIVVEKVIEDEDAHVPQASPPTNDLVILDDDTPLDEIDWISNMAKEIPPGSLFDDYLRPISPMDVREFDILDPISDYIQNPHGALLDMPLMNSDRHESVTFVDVWTT